jgi:acetolactate synthase-1/2/3 large subunit
VKHELRTGADILVAQLLLQGVSRLTCVPGESFLAVLDALRDSPIDTLVCRQEGGAAMMAEAHGKLTGRPGICFVTRGPGATNASAGLHVAAHDSTPMILFVGQIERGLRGRGAFQELDYRKSFEGIAKWVCEIDDPARIPELVARAFAVALQGRPGPVVVALPEDMLVERAAVADAPRVAPARAAPAAADLAQLRHRLAAAHAPLLVVGGSQWDSNGLRALRCFAEAWKLPVVSSFRRANVFPADHPQYVGELGLNANPALVRLIRSADLVIAIEARLAEVPSANYTLFEIPAPQTMLVHVHADPAELGRTYQPALAINAGPNEACEALATLVAPAAVAWADRLLFARGEFDAWSRVPHPIPGRFQYGQAVEWLSERLPPDAIVCNGAGNYAIWLHRFFRYGRQRTQLAPTSGSMGYGVPAAVIAKRQFPHRAVVAFAGDGCFMMTVQEFATAVQYELPIVVIVVDNAMFGTIRMHQERSYPARVSATELRNPDFAALAQAFGGHGERVESTEEFEPAFERAIASGRPALLHCLLSAEAVTPTATLQSLRAAA